MAESGIAESGRAEFGTAEMRRAGNQRGEGAPGAPSDDAPSRGETCTEVYEGGGRSVLRHVLHMLLPCPCLGCLQPVWRPAESPGLCRTCLGRLVAAPAELATADEGAPSWAFEYRPPLDEVIQAMKFRRLDYLAEALAALAAPAARRAALRAGGVDAVVPVPLHWRRRWRRGYDQTALLASALSRQLAVPLRWPLRRCRATPAQSLRDREQRERNLAGAFALRLPRGGHGAVGIRLLLVDDVITTGSTLEAAAECLRRGGVSMVLPFAVARTPKEGV